mgnify:CR=1 FL=1
MWINWKRYASSCVLKPAKFQKRHNKMDIVVSTCTAWDCITTSFMFGFSQDLRAEIGDSSLTLLRANVTKISWYLWDWDADGGSKDAQS